MSEAKMERYRVLVEISGWVSLVASDRERAASQALKYVEDQFNKADIEIKDSVVIICYHRKD